MQSPEQDPDATRVAVDGSPEAALRDAQAVAERAAADAEIADARRAELRIAPLAPIEPDRIVRSHLFPGEQVYAVRRSAILGAPGAGTGLGYGGTLYLTSRRLLHLGQVVVSVQLSDIVEVSQAGERLLLSLREGEGFSLDLDLPRALRTELAAALHQLPANGAGHPDR